MSDFYIAVTESNRIFGINDCHGVNVAWLFDDKAKAKTFLKDFINHMPNKKIVSFRDADVEGLEALATEHLLYPYVNPRMDLMMTSEDSVFPVIVERTIGGDD